MKKSTLVATLLVLLATPLAAQQVQETTVRIGDLTVPAYTLTLPKSSSTCRDALHARMKESKMKTKKKDGYTASLGRVCQEIAPSAINFYAKVDGSKNESTITFCAMPTDLMMSQATINEGVRRYAESFVQYIGRYEVLLLLENKEKELKKARSVAKDAAKELKKLEGETKKEKKQLANRQKEIEKCNARIKECEKDIAHLQQAIEKAQGQQHADVQQRVEQAEQRVKEIETEVENYRQLAK